jgi:hypothetical protein
VNAFRLCVVLAAVIALEACATTTETYNWGGYEHSLYGYYKDPTKLGDLSQTLAAIIKSAEMNKATVPPGIYAEYGYLQLQAGKGAEAVTMFEQEKARWPESRVFMDSMIKAASIPAPAAAVPAATP